MTVSYSRQVINPWTWQEDLGFVQAVQVSGGRTLYLSGSVAVDDGGKPVHAGDIRGQVVHALDNIEIMLEAADMKWEHLVRLNWYIVGSAVDDFWTNAFPDFRDRLRKVNCRATGTLLGVTRLAEPELLCEFEATAVAA